MQDAADAAYLNANGITFAILGDGPYEEIAPFRDFMGYTAPWYSNAPPRPHRGRRRPDLLLVGRATPAGDIANA